MALSDACADFLEGLSSGTNNAKEAVKELAAAVERYSTAPWDYDSGEIPALRKACAAVLSAPTGANASRAHWLAAVVRLVVLAEQVRAFHDTPEPTNAAWLAPPATTQGSLPLLALVSG